MIRAIIIEDIPEAREALVNDVKNHCPNIDIVGEAGTVVGAAKLIRELKPDVVFLDVDLKDGTGFDLLEILSDFSFKIIFTTASDAHAIRAFRFSAIDYLLKPINVKELKEAVSRLDRESHEKVDTLLHNISATNNPDKLTLHNSDKILVSSLDDIIRCEADSNYTTFYFTDGSHFLVSKTLKRYDETLRDYGFVRVHQSHLVNMQHVRSFEKSDGGYLRMMDDSIIPVSVRKRSAVLKLLGS